LIANANTDIFALFKPQLKDVQFMFFLQYVGHIKLIITQVTIMKEQIVIVISKEQAVSILPHQNRHSWSYFAFT